MKDVISITIEKFNYQGRRLHIFGQGSLMPKQDSSLYFLILILHTILVYQSIVVSKKSRVSNHSRG